MKIKDVANVAVIKSDKKALEYLINRDLELAAKAKEKFF